MSYYYDIFADKKDFNINDFKKHMLTNDFMKTLTKQSVFLQKLKEHSND